MTFDFGEQELLFHELVLLFRSANGDIQNAAREALLRLNVRASLLHPLSSLLSFRLTGCSRSLGL